MPKDSHEEHDDTESTEKAALRLIARAEQCSTGLKRKLEMRGHKSVNIEAVISRLTEQKLIDDSRYARLWLQTRVRLTRTPKRLLIGLINKGITREEAQAALDTVLDEETEFAMLERFAQKHKEKACDQLKYLLRSESFSQETIKNFFSSP